RITTWSPTSPIASTSPTGRRDHPAALWIPSSPRRSRVSDVFATAVLRALDGLRGYAPEPLLEHVMFHLRRTGEVVDESELVEMLTATDPNDPVRVGFHIQLSHWDNTDQEDWTRDDDGVLTRAGTKERRALVLRLLGLGP